jgi:glycosidase
MNMKIACAFILSIIVLSFSQLSYAQKQKKGKSPETVTLDKVEPMFWWAGMKHPHLQVLVYGKGIGNTKVSMSEYEGVKLGSVEQVENPNYLFINLYLSPTVKAGKFDFKFTDITTQKALTYSYELKERTYSANEKQGLSPKDVMYLIMPDRFANGDYANDELGMKEKIDRTFQGGKHGGDFKGILDHLDYIKDLGVTTVWLNPFFENNNPKWSYHGYAITDFYKSDARYGSNEDYKNFVKKLHDEGLKVVMDMVFNHCSNQHWWHNDLPSKDWYNQHASFTKSNFTAEALTDPYSAEQDKYQMLTGWFDNHMPDLNQNNPLLKNYLIQNSIWWIEYSGIDGIRMDTYPYPYKEAMGEWTKRVSKEYPQFYMVGETWIANPMRMAYWQKGGPDNQDGYESNLTAISDFPLYYAIEGGFKWGQGVRAYWDALTLDFQYGKKDAFMNKIFVDNHDVDRYFSYCDGDMRKYKLGLSFLLTTRGIPQILYGTELLMKGKSDDGYKREDFPGGWKDDKVNAFTKEGRTAEQNEAFDFLRNVLNWRKTNKAVTEGTLKHFIPQDNVYVYFREKDGETVMVVLSSNNNDVTFKLDRFKECIKEFTSGKDINSGKEVSLKGEFTIPAMGSMILELKK